MTKHKSPIEAQRLVNGFRAFQLIAAACRLQIPDLVASGPRAADELAADTGTHAMSLRRGAARSGRVFEAVVVD